MKRFICFTNLDYKKFLFSFLAATLVLQVNAQTAESIRSGRPGQSIGPFAVGDGLFQIQSGFFFNQLESPNSERDLFGNNTVLRFGISESFELSAVYDHISGIGETDPRLPEIHINSLQIGARYHLLDQDGIIPNLAIQSRLWMPDLSSDEIGTLSVIATSHSFLECYTFFTNWKLLTLEGLDSQFAYTANLSRAMNERIGLFAEVYGSLSDFTTNFDAGIGYLLNDDLQLDMSAGIQNQGELNDWYIDAGVSWRLMPNR